MTKGHLLFDFTRLFGVLLYSSLCSESTALPSNSFVDCLGESASVRINLRRSPSVVLNVINIDARFQRFDFLDSQCQIICSCYFHVISRQSHLCLTSKSVCHSHLFAYVDRGYEITVAVLGVTPFVRPVPSWLSFISHPRSCLERHLVSSSQLAYRSLFTVFPVRSTPRRFFQVL